MAKITFIEPDGTERAVDARSGLSAMETAVHDTVNGIVAECGGNCACGTCRVYVDEAWRDRLAPPSETEQAMLDFIDDPDPALRLSCQIEVSDELDGLVLRVSPTQY